jgi:hypothetical protein
MEPWYLPAKTDFEGSMDSTNYRLQTIEDNNDSLAHGREAIAPFVPPRIFRRGDSFWMLVTM